MYIYIYNKQAHVPHNCEIYLTENYWFTTILKRDYTQSSLKFDVVHNIAIKTKTHVDRQYKRRRKFAMNSYLG